VALAAVENESSVQDEEMEPPAGFLDMVTQEVLRDPIVASDGYSYGYNSLRRMFLADAQRFKERGGRPRRVMSLKDPGLELQNPFPDVPGWPSSFPLIRNHDLRLAIDEWLLQHGLPSEKDDAEEAKEPIYSRRDGDGFQNGIFYGENAAVAEEKKEEEEDEDVRRDRAIASLLDLDTYESLKVMEEWHGGNSRDLSQDEVSFNSVLYTAFGIEDRVFSVAAEDIEWEPQSNQSAL